MDDAYSPDPPSKPALPEGVVPSNPDAINPMAAHVLLGGYQVPWGWEAYGRAEDPLYEPSAWTLGGATVEPRYVRKTSNAEGEGVPSVVPMDTGVSSTPHEGQPDGCLSPDTPLTDQDPVPDDEGVKHCTKHTKPVVGKRRLDGVSPMPNGGVYPLGTQPLADVVAHAEKDTDRRHKAQQMTVTAQIVDDRQRIVAIVVDGHLVDA